MTARLHGLLLLGLAACTDPPVTYSAPVGISLQARSADSTNGIVTDLKAIATEQGNPYGAFVSDAKELLAGRSPAAIVVEGAVVSLGADSNGVTRLGDVFAGTLSIVFLINDSNNSYGVAAAEVEPTSGGTLRLEARFDSVALTELDYLKLLAGQFKVIARGPVAKGFADLDARGDLDVTLTFAAFE
ncbi:hypothetical protein BH11MYX3_BH11MYX3_05160 [soil metagenome]